jgi:ATP synthase subunit 6
MLFSPLEQFRILVLARINFFNWDISITNSSIILSIIATFFVIFFYVNLEKNTYLFTRWQYILELVYNFVSQLVRQQINNLISARYFPLVLFIFVFILFSNLIGLLPYGFTITGHVVLTLQIALSVFIGITIIGLYNNGLSFFNLFVPTGIPKILKPFLVTIEVASYIIRPFSLAIRLFANMLAGHTLLNILRAFTFNVFKNYILIVFLPVLFVFFIMTLEICIAFVQAYIFSILICIYLNDMYNTSH